MIVVVDASMAAGWVLPDEQNAVLEVILDQVEEESALVPPIFWHKLINILLKIERRGRGTHAATGAALMKLRGLPFEVGETRGDDIVLKLARDYNLSAYDAAYLDVAVHHDLPLATLDRRLAAGAHAAGVPVLGPYAAPIP